jgi:hypothetical protein
MIELDVQGVGNMATETEPDIPSENSAEVYDHQVRTPAGAGIALVASWIFFGGGQLLKGHYKRFLVLWAILAGLIGAMIFVSRIFGPESPGREVTTYVGGAAVVLLWFYQVWDAFTRP